MKQRSFREALACIESVENKLDLSTWTINGVYIWKLLRFSVFRRYLRFLGVHQEAHPEKKRLRKSSAAKVKERLKQLCFRNPFFVRGNVRRIIRTWEKKKKINNKIVDPITYHTWKDSIGDTTLVLDSETPLFPNPIDGSCAPQVLLNLGRLVGLAVSISLEEQDTEMVRAINDALLVNRTRNVLTANQVRSRVRRFIGVKHIYKLLYSWVKPDIVYLVCGYNKEPLVAAAQEKGIPVAEFQHGAIGRGHLGYDYKGWGAVPYFPNCFLAFGPAWFNDVYMPTNTEIIVTGSPHIEKRIEEATKHVTRKTKQLLVLSQGTISEKLLREVAVFIKKRPDWQVIVRPHPSESSDVLKRQLIEFVENSPKRVQVGNEQSLSEQAAQSGVALGVNSTAIIESMLAGCRVALMPLGSANTYKDLSRNGKAKTVQNGTELAEVIDDIPEGDARDYYAKPVDDVVSFIEGNYLT